MRLQKKIRLGDLLVNEGLITEQQLLESLVEQKKSGRKLGQVLVDKEFVTEVQIDMLLSDQLQIPFIDLKSFDLSNSSTCLLSETQARRFRAIILSQNKNGMMLIGMADPTDIFAYDEMVQILKQPFNQAIVTESDLRQSIDRLYRKTDEISNIAGELHEELAEDDIDIEHLSDNVDVAEAPVMRLIQSIFEDAVRVGASDIHIEPDENVLRIRQRVDGMLQEQIVNELRISAALTLKLKLMAGLNISEKRLPQDGRFHIHLQNHGVDIRLSTLPMTTGESVVMRLLDQSGGTLSLDQLGMRDRILKRFKKLIHLPNGLILVTGPTGSGKTTTLYSALSELNNPETKIITTEDPVEYRLPRINQVQINNKVGLTFPVVLRTALRQDPDIVLVGEMRDQETAEIGLRAAMTGHLVLSTLHTNDAISTANRLLDMGAEGFLVATSLKAIIAQRLIRRICENCRTPVLLTPDQLALIEQISGDKEWASTVTAMEGTGCSQCNSSGYSGRIGIHELLEINTPLADELRNNDAAKFATVARSQPTFVPLAKAALEYVNDGLTTLDEVLRVAGSIEH
jgi:MSHA biogenesis protein MshE